MSSFVSKDGYFLAVCFMLLASCSGGGFTRATNSETSAIKSEAASLKTQNSYEKQGYQFIAKTPPVAGTPFLQCIDDKTCWVIGTDKTWETTDGGHGWNTPPISNPSTSLLSGMRYYSANFAIAWYTDGYYITNSSGKSWEKAPKTPIDFPNGQLEVVLLDDNKNVAWVAGGQYRLLQKGEGIGWPNYWYSPDRKSVLEPVLYRSTDNGITWHRIRFPLKTGTIDSLRFYDSKRGIGISYRAIYRTVDGGETWQAIKEATNCVKKLDLGDYYEGRPVTSCSIGTKEIWMAYDDGRLTKSNDGGISWCDILVAGAVKFESTSRKHFIDLHFLDPLKGWGLGGDNYLYKTTDGGKNWNRLDADIAIHSIEYMNNYALVLAEEGLFRLSLDN